MGERLQARREGTPFPSSPTAVPPVHATVFRLFFDFLWLAWHCHWPAGTCFVLLYRPCSFHQEGKAAAHNKDGAAA